MEAVSAVVLVHSCAFQRLGVVAEGGSCKFAAVGGATGRGLNIGPDWAFQNGASASIDNKRRLAGGAIFLPKACAVEADTVAAEAVIEGRCYSSICCSRRSSINCLNKCSILWDSLDRWCCYGHRSLQDMTENTGFNKAVCPISTRSSNSSLRIFGTTASNFGR